MKFRESSPWAARPPADEPTYFGRLLAVALVLTVAAVSAGLLAGSL